MRARPRSCEGRGAKSRSVTRYSDSEIDGMFAAGLVAQRALDDSEKAALKGTKGVEKFSIAHLEEVIVRSLLHDKTIPDVVKELIDHAEKFSEGFEEKKEMGIGLR